MLYGRNNGQLRIVRQREMPGCRPNLGRAAYLPPQGSFPILIERNSRPRLPRTLAMTDHIHIPQPSALGGSTPWVAK
jgi:hypothetical protein